MPDDGQYDQNMQQVLTELIKFVVVESILLLSFTIYVNLVA